MHIHRPAHRLPKRHDFHSDSTLHVIAVVSNPARFKSRFGLYEEFAEHVRKHPMVHLVTLEVATGHVPHEVTDQLDPDHTQLSHRSELWIKENMINLAVRRLPQDWKYMAWIDADISFLNPNWAEETIRQLQTHNVVQLFESAADLGPRRNIIKLNQGFAASYVRGEERVFNSESCGYGYDEGDRERLRSAFWHPGYAWAIRREAYENLDGGLLDFAILGSADHHMALSFIGEVKHSLPTGLHEKYYQKIMEWEAAALRAANKDIGYVSGSILHNWHGPKAARKYVGRWDVLKEHQYNPFEDVARDENGLLYLSNHHKTGLRDDIRRYFRQRDEDSLTQD